MKLEVLPQSYGVRYLFDCPGCMCSHFYDVRADGKHPSWAFNGNLESPTFTPSLLCRATRPLTDAEIDTIMAGGHVEPVPTVCHLFLTAGRLQFLGDCTHGLAGQTVELPDVTPTDPYAGMCAPGTHRWNSREQHTPDSHEWVTWCKECGCEYDPREED